MLVTLLKFSQTHSMKWQLKTIQRCRKTSSVEIKNSKHSLKDTSDLNAFVHWATQRQTWCVYVTLEYVMYTMKGSSKGCMASESWTKHFPPRWENVCPKRCIWFEKQKYENSLFEKLKVFGIIWTNQGSNVSCFNLNFLSIWSHPPGAVNYTFWYEKYICAEHDAYSLWETPCFAFTQLHVFTSGTMFRYSLLAAAVLKPTYQSLQRS